MFPKRAILMSCGKKYRRLPSPFHKLFGANPCVHAWLLVIWAGPPFERGILISSSTRIQPSTYVCVRLKKHHKILSFSSSSAEFVKVVLYRYMMHLNAIFVTSYFSPLGVENYTRGHSRRTPSQMHAQK